MPSFVIIWENNTVGHQKVKGRTWIGHAAMNIGSQFGTGRYGPDANYVSWWSAIEYSNSTKKDLEKGRPHPSFLADIDAEHYLPDHIIRLDSTAEQELAMRAAWQEIHSKQGASFKMLKKNCSTIASRVLHAGRFYARKWALDCNFVWTPADIRKLAVAAGGTLMQWDDFLAVLAESQITPDRLTSDGQTITHARSGRFCTTGAPCQFQQNG